MSRPVILAFVHYYLPGFKGGGPARSISNLVDHLGSELEFRILASDRDHGDAQPYTGLIPGAWQVCHGTSVLYMPAGLREFLSMLRRALAARDYGVMYLNTLFSFRYSILPLIAGTLVYARGKPVLLAPRGELSPGALELKWWKKSAFLWLARICGLYRRVHWQASSEREAADIRAWFGAARIFVASDLAPVAVIPGAVGLEPSGPKRPGTCRAVFISRIAPKKNLDLALGILREVDGTVSFDIYGPVSDAIYWQTCQALLGALPRKVEASYRGELSNERVIETFARYDVFLFPTRGENFGHVILEALTAGCPVLTSDQTPWLDLAAKGVGWNLPLSDVSGLKQAFQAVIDMDEEELAARRESARRYARAFASGTGNVEANRGMFLRVLAAPPGE